MFEFTFAVAILLYGRTLTHLSIRIPVLVALFMLGACSSMHWRRSKHWKGWIQFVLRKLRGQRTLSRWDSMLQFQDLAHFKNTLPKFYHPTLNHRPSSILIGNYSYPAFEKETFIQLHCIINRTCRKLSLRRCQCFLRCTWPSFDHGRSGLHINPVGSLGWSRHGVQQRCSSPCHGALRHWLN